MKWYCNQSESLIDFFTSPHGTPSVSDALADGIRRAGLGKFFGGENLMRTTSRIAIAILLGGAGTGLMMAQTMTLTGVYNWNSLDGIYDSPYTATINGVSEDVICDDFADEVSIGENWKVNPAGTISATSTSTGLFGPESSVQYQEVAWLSEQLGTYLTNPQTAADVAMQGDISYAIWAVFDSNGVNGVKSWLQSYGDTTTYSAVFGTNGLLAQAAANYGSASPATVYTPSGYTGAGNAGEPQEFIVVGPAVSAAEAPAAATLGIDLLGLGALFFVFRRQRSAVR
jgi:hypothetical protein